MRQPRDEHPRGPLLTPQRTGSAAWHGTAQPPRPCPQHLPEPLSRAAGSAPVQPSERWCSSGPKPPACRLRHPASRGLSCDSDRAPPGDSPAPGWPQGPHSTRRWYCWGLQSRTDGAGAQHPTDPLPHRTPGTPHVPCPTAGHPEWVLSTLRAPSPTACSVPLHPSPTAEHPGQMLSTAGAPTPLQSTHSGYRAPRTPPALPQSTQSGCPAPQLPPAPPWSTQGGH